MALILRATALILLCVATSHAGTPIQVAQRIAPALADEDPWVRWAALRYLHDFGDASCLPMLRRSLGETDTGIRDEAVRAAGQLASWSESSIDVELLEAFRAGLLDSEVRVRVSAYVAWGLIASRMPLADDEVARFGALVRAEPDRHAKVSGLYALAAMNAKGCDDLIVAWLRESPDERTSRMLADCLNLVREPHSCAAVRLLLEHKDALVRYYALLTLERLGDAREGDERYRLAAPSPDERSAYFESGAIDLRELYKTAKECDEAVMHAAIARAQVVFVGEMHGRTETQTLQIELLRQIVERSGKEHVALGCETPVLHAQEAVIDVARALGVRVIPLEPELPDWGSRVTVYMAPTRDRHAASKIEGWLNESDERRMLVIYGESHLLGEGHIPELIEARSVVILTTELVPIVRALGVEPDPLGRTFALGTSGRHFYRPTVNWLERVPRGGPELFARLRAE
jgi:HEAT repeat protein